MQSYSAVDFLPKTVYVDYRGIQSYRYTPGALTTKQFDVYVKYLSEGFGREQAKQLALESPKR